MGTCYVVDGKLKFKKDSVKEGLGILKEHFFRKPGVDFGFNSYGNYKNLEEVKTIEDAIKITFVDHQGMLTIKHPNELDYNFNSGFDASYGWEEVIYDFFKYLSPCLEDGSQMWVWPDSGCTKLIIEDGKWKEL